MLVGAEVDPYPMTELPKGTTHRVVPDDGETSCTSSSRRGEYRLPDKGILGRHALFDPGVHRDARDRDPHDETGRVRGQGEAGASTRP